ncbi:hypothetical protein JZK55_17040 [Dissulfurispira thermophila]|uniref:Uncharacterized protein n=2 Tax=Dissulfurispira thermophila TaxID=2715679 RepID=A0A7G1H3R7_9BACT|nr:hypothetical protein JZK55_17040 [Dissulfurispira thermophila]
MLTEDAVRLSKLSKEKLIAAMRSRKQYRESILPESKGQLVTMSQNGVFLAFRDNVVYNAFIPERKGYFKDVSKGRLKKWAERLKRILIQPFTR